MKSTYTQRKVIDRPKSGDANMLKYFISLTTLIKDLDF